MAVTSAPTASLNLGPLTTLFTPDAYCLDMWANGMFGPNLAPTISVACITTPTLGECWPPRSTSYPSVTYIEQVLSEGYFSPGFCPSGWEPQHVEYYAPTTSNDAQVVTVANCCPTGYMVSTDSYYYNWINCISTQAKGMPFKVQVYTSSWGSDLKPTYTLLSKDATATVPYPLVVTVFAIEVRWRSQDVNKQFSELATYLLGLNDRFPGPTITSHVGSSLSFSSATGAGGSLTFSPSAPTVSSSSIPSHSSGVGGAVFLPLVLVLPIIAMAICLIRRKRERKKASVKGLEIQQQVLGTFVSNPDPDQLHGPSTRPPSYRTVEIRPTSPELPEYRSDGTAVHV